MFARPEPTGDQIEQATTAIAAGVINVSDTVVSIVDFRWQAFYACGTDGLLFTINDMWQRCAYVMLIVQLRHVVIFVSPSTLWNPVTANFNRMPNFLIGRLRTTARIRISFSRSPLSLPR